MSTDPSARCRFLDTCSTTAPFLCSAVRFFDEFAFLAGGGLSESGPESRPKSRRGNGAAEEAVDWRFFFAAAAAADADSFFPLLRPVEGPGAFGSSCSSNSASSY